MREMLLKELAVEATEIFNGKPADFNTILSMNRKYKTGLPSEN